jgi:hypothetical protein
MQNMANSRRRYKGIAAIIGVMIEGAASLRSAKVQKLWSAVKVDHAGCASAMVDRRETTSFQRAH